MILVLFALFNFGFCGMNIAFALDSNYPAVSAAAAGVSLAAGIINLIALAGDQ